MYLRLRREKASVVGVEISQAKKSYDVPSDHFWPMQEPPTNRYRTEIHVDATVAARY